MTGSTDVSLPCTDCVGLVDGVRIGRSTWLAVKFTAPLSAHAVAPCAKAKGHLLALKLVKHEHFGGFPCEVAPGSRKMGPSSNATALTAAAAMAMASATIAVAAAAMAVAAVAMAWRRRHLGPGGRWL